MIDSSGTVQPCSEEHNARHASLPSGPSLHIAIPALNEAASITDIIERTLAARADIMARAGVSNVTITVVSDGSTDQTAKLASRYVDQIQLIEFDENRGYGAAIMAAWQQSDADLLGFLDADGTCDPAFFADLVLAMQENDSDIALGCRMNANSRMPPLRRFGNRLFACMMSAFSSTLVRDTASGMRVVRRASLHRLMPLPQGLHFTPAMSARGMLARDLTITEVDMPYHERAGRSKLHPWRDGWRFLKVIVETALLHRPSRPLGMVAAALLLLAVGMMSYPAWYYLQHGFLEEWMIYRFLVSDLLTSVALLLYCASYLGNKAANIALSTTPVKDRYRGVGGWIFSRRWFWLLPALLVLVGIALVFHALRDFLATGRVYEHWSRFVAMSFCLSLAATLGVTRLVDWCLNLLAARAAYLRSATTLGSADAESQGNG